MTVLFELKDRLRRIYTAYDGYIRPLLKFLFALLCLFAVQAYIGENARLANPAILLGASLLCAFLPWGAAALLAGLFILGNTFVVSYTVTAVLGLTMFIVLVLYCGFRPGNTVVLALVPLCFFLHVPYIMPLVLGLCAGAAAVVPAAFGVIIWFLMRYVHENAASLEQTADPSKLVGEFTTVMKAVFGSRYLLLVLFAFLLCILLVSLIRQLPVNHAWTIAILAGTAVLGLVMVLGGTLAADTPFVWDILELLGALLLALLYEHLFFAVDYAHVQRLEFEDDDYYYYVKAVPKIHYDEEEERW